METVIQDLRYAIRQLTKSPGFTIAAVLALGLGIGGNTAIFSTLNTMLLKPLPFPEGERLVSFWDENPQQGRMYNEVAPAHIVALRARAKAVESIAVYDYAGYTLTGSGEPERLTGFVLSQGFLPLLGVQPILGRNFLPEEDRNGGANVVLLSYELWQRRFQGERDIIGRSLTLNGFPTTVIGVLPERFQFESRADAYMPLAMPDSVWENRRAHFLRVVGRLAPGASIAEARTQASDISQSLERDFPETNRGWRITVWRAAEGLYQGPVKPALVSLLGGVGFVLLIACADVANLLLVRAAGRRREIAVRLSLGATRGRLVRQLLTESVLLAACGGVLGVMIASWWLGLTAGGIPARIFDFTPRLRDLRVDGTALAFTALLTAVTGIAFGLAPAWRAARGSLKDALHEGGQSGIAGRGRLRGILVGAEVALALVLIAGASLMVQSFARQMGANPGFQPDRLLTLTVSPQAPRYPDGPSIAAFEQTLLERVRVLPGVTGAVVTSAIPLSGSGGAGNFTIAGRPAPRETDLPLAAQRSVSEDYFTTLGIPVMRGRAITVADRIDGAMVAVISESLARQYFAGSDPIGQRVFRQNDTIAREIVGVVGDVADWKIGTRSSAYIYFPFQQVRSRQIGLMLRTGVDPASLSNSVRRTVYAIDPDLPVFQMQPMSELMEFALFDRRMSAQTMGGLAIIALLLAIVGIYGVVAHAAGQRTRELGLRMALGAQPGQILGMIVRQGMRPVAIGLAIGLAGAFGLTQAMERILFQVRAGDPATMLLSGAVLALAALAAAWVPARRAAKTDPMLALRTE